MRRPHRVRKCTSPSENGALRFAYCALRTLTGRGENAALTRAPRAGDSTVSEPAKAAHLSATSLLSGGDYRAHFVLPPPWIPAEPSESPSTLKPPSTLGELMPS